MPTYLVRHNTVYRYKNPVAFGEHRMMFRPRDGFDQRARDFRLEIRPDPVAVGWAEDASGNLVGHASFGRRATELHFRASVTVEQVPFGIDGVHIAEHARAAPFSYGTEEMRDLSRFIESQYVDPERAVDLWARRIMAEDPARDTWAFLGRLNAAIRRDFAYLRREEPGIQDPVLTLKTGRGSCRDFAALMAEGARSQGLATRFVSGYLRVRSSNARTRLAGGSTHAWLQVYLPGAGWIDFDPTSGTIGNRDLVRVAVVRDPAQASPLGGSFIGFPSDFIGMKVDVSVSLVDEQDHAVGTNLYEPA